MCAAVPTMMSPDPMSRVFGDPYSDQKVILNIKPDQVQSVDAVLACPPPSPNMLATRLLGALVPMEQLAHSICTEADGRDTLPTNILLAIKCKQSIIFYLTLFTVVITFRSCGLHFSTAIC